jgi:hypothetical protein
VITVSRDEFFAYVCPRDIVTYSHPEYTAWETRSRVVVGRSLPGWKSPGDPKVYMLTESAYAEGRTRKVAA